jgi:hypothetical protein
MSEVRGKLFDWDSGVCFDVHYPYGVASPGLKSAPQPMPRSVKNHATLIDEATGEEVTYVVAYDTARGVVDRLLLRDGKPFIAASRDRPATITEFRRLRIQT